MGLANMSALFFMAQLYNDYSGFIKKQFGCRVQKISVSAGFTCPNRDGNKGTGGCIYCDNSAFNPSYINQQKSISQQLKDGIDYFAVKYPSQKYIAYFQSYTNTYSSADIIKAKIEEAINYPGIAGISVATRPDCINDEILQMLAEYTMKCFVAVEYGVESTIDKTLELINRCHSWSDSVNAINKTASYGISTCAHLIIALPGENENDFIHHVKELSVLPVSFVKFHQLQILSQTPVAKMYSENPELFRIYNVDEYCDLMCELISHLNPRIIIERFTGESPPERVIAPKWNKIKNFEVTEIIHRKLAKKGIRQGDRCK